MIIEPKVRDFICTTAHPDGCMENVRRQVEYTKQLGQGEGPKKVLVIGASTGYGLASRIALTYGFGAATIGVSFERPAAGKRTATPGWYNTKAFEELAGGDGFYAKSVNGDAFSAQIKKETIEMIREDLGQVDMVVYSLAAPKRTTADGVTYLSVLKTTGEPFTNKTLDLRNRKVTEVTMPPASEEEITATVKVMGGEDWRDWICTMEQAGVLADGAVTVAYSYIGPEVTYPIYFNGTIGLAKKHLYDTSLEISRQFAEKGVRAYISVNKAQVTQASAAIPVVPLYLSILYRVMKEKGTHEGCIEQMNRLFREKLVSGEARQTDDQGRIRLDDYELRDEIQEAAKKAWYAVDDSNLDELADVDGYWEDFYHMFGFHYDNVDYTRDVTP